MSPMFSKMEEAVSKNTKMLDDIQKCVDRSVFAIFHCGFATNFIVIVYLHVL